MMVKKKQLNSFQIVLFKNNFNQNMNKYFS
jgi:hypothetical protein